MTKGENLSSKITKPQPTQRRKLNRIAVSRWVLTYEKEKFRT
jgi:hypothetical protein